MADSLPKPYIMQCKTANSSTFAQVGIHSCTQAAGISCRFWHMHVQKYSQGDALGGHKQAKANLYQPNGAASSDSPSIPIADKQVMQAHPNYCVASHTVCFIHSNQLNSPKFPMASRENSEHHYIAPFLQNLLACLRLHQKHSAPAGIYASPMLAHTHGQDCDTICI